ncbi:hypothetical protein QQZ08_004731 [Neonectria magnoliae]|uniref:Uncharacterized protein n=1 Tax=Neonectria magnoliae TaxID=2732573 RepID=A0ABR1I7J6_9HYPO
MSENINPDQCSRVMAAIQTNESLLSLDIWDHADMIGLELDLEDLSPKDAAFHTSKQ